MPSCCIVSSFHLTLDLKQILQAQGRASGLLGNRGMSSVRTRASAKEAAARNTRLSLHKPQDKSQSKVTHSNKSRLSSVSNLTPTTTIKSSTTSTKEILERLVLLEGKFETLVAENQSLKLDVNALRTRCDEQQQLINVLNSAHIASEQGISTEQQQLNSNIIIRGIEIGEDTPPETIPTIFDNLCKHIGIECLGELKPVSIEVLDSNQSSSKKSSRTIRVKFSSVANKRSFLQVRRAKRDILPCEIKVRQESQRPILISEELTKANQRLLFEARSLRGRFQFVWSNNGQVLARERKRAKVIRILDENHVETLKLKYNVRNGVGQQSPVRTAPRD